MRILSLHLAQSYILGSCLVLSPRKVRDLPGQLSHIAPVARPGKYYVWGLYFISGVDGRNYDGSRRASKARWAAGNPRRNFTTTHHGGKRPSSIPLKAGYVVVFTDIRSNITISNEKLGFGGIIRGRYSVPRSCEHSRTRRKLWEQFGREGIGREVCLNLAIGKNVMARELAKKNVAQLFFFRGNKPPTAFWYVVDDKIFPETSWYRVTTDALPCTGSQDRLKQRERVRESVKKERRTPETPPNMGHTEARAQFDSLMTRRGNNGTMAISTHFIFPSM